jgi:histidine triad (HIT) family protein
MAETVFAKILRGEISSDRVYEDADFVAFRDLAPAAPTHILLVSREERMGPADLGDEDAQWLGRMVVVATKIADEQGLRTSGYRLVMNQGEYGGQAIPHLHMHILGGERLGPFA